MGQKKCDNPQCSSYGAPIASGDYCPVCGNTPTESGELGSNDHEIFAGEAEQQRIGILSEFWFFLKHNKKWWLLPMLLVIALLALLMVLASNPAAPFIYPLF